MLDVDAATLQHATDRSTKGAVSFEDILQLPLRPASEYRDRNQELYSPLSRRWLYNVPRTGLTEGVRPMAMLALLDNAESIYGFSPFAFGRLPRPSQRAIQTASYLSSRFHPWRNGKCSRRRDRFPFATDTFRVGTGCRSSRRRQHCRENRRVSTELATACGIACLREIAHFYRTDGLHPGIPGLPYDHLSTPPWNNVYLVHGGRLGRPTGWSSAVQQMSDFICIDTCTALGAAFDAARAQSFDDASADPECEWQPWLRTLATRKLDLTAELNRS